MDKAKLIVSLNDIEKKGLRFSDKSFVCGTHTNVATQNAMRVSGEEFSKVIDDLRKAILSEKE